MSYPLKESREKKEEVREMMAKQDSSSEPKRTKLSARKEVRVIRIGNPKMVKASPSEFSAVVQSLTGLKKRKSSPSSCKSKVRRIEGGFDQLCIHETALVPKMGHESNDKYDGVDQEEICEMFGNHMVSTLDCFDGKFFPDIFSFDFMTSTSDVV